MYNSTLAEKFVNSMMWEGKKNTAQGIFYDAMTKLQERSGEALGSNADIKEFYLGLTEVGARKSYRDVKHYKRRKRWLS